MQICCRSKVRVADPCHSFGSVFYFEDRIDCEIGCVFYFEDRIGCVFYFEQGTNGLRVLLWGPNRLRVLLWRPNRLCVLLWRPNRQRDLLWGPNRLRVLLCGPNKLHVKFDNASQKTHLLHETNWSDWPGWQSSERYFIYIVSLVLWNILKSKQLTPISEFSSNKFENWKHYEITIYGYLFNTSTQMLQKQML